MKKIILNTGIVVIDGNEYTVEEIKTALVEQYKFHQLSDFLRNTLNSGEVVE